MLAISLNDDSPDNPDPWLTLIELGIKTDESRWWDIWPQYKNQLPLDLLLCGSADSRTENRGKAVCVVELFGSEKFLPEHETAACIERYDGYVWHLRNLRWLSQKFPVKGRQKFFTVDIPKGIELYTPTQQQRQDALHQFKIKYNF